MQGPVIEQAAVEDADVLRALSVAAFQDDYRQYGGKPPGIERTDWHADFSRTGHYYKIVHDGEVAGGIGLILEDPANAEVKIFFIDDRFQGMGLGTKVMTAIEAEYPDITTWTLVTPYKAFRNHHFYGKLGYRKTGEIQPNPDREFKVFEYVKEVQGRSDVVPG